MEKQVIHVRMFHSMELEYNGHVIKNMDNRSQKLWLILAYIIHFRKKGVSQEALLSAIWNGTESGSGVLKTALHRVRGMLAEAYDEEFGKEFLCCRNKMYSVGEVYTLVCDVEEFDCFVRLARQAKDEEEQFGFYKSAFELYRGEFLNSFAEMPWVTPLQVYYHNLYLEVVCSLLEICEKKNCFEEAIEILRRAQEVEKYEEILYVYQMRYLLRIEQHKEVMKVYKQLSDMMAEHFDEKPSEEAKSIYYEAMYALSTKLVDIDEIPELVKKRDTNRKAMYCEFDFFKELYHSYSEGIMRSKQEICLAMIDITDIQDRLLSKRSLACCVANLKEILCKNLRSGDIVSMCSPCQFVLLLPNAKEADVEMVVERVKKAYFKKYVHSPAKLTSYVKKVVSVTEGGN